MEPLQVTERHFMSAARRATHQTTDVLWMFFGVQLCAFASVFLEEKKSFREEYVRAAS